MVLVELVVTVTVEPCPEVVTVLVTVFVPQPVMGKSAAELKAYVEGDDPATGVPVMQEIVAALTTALSEGAHG